MYASHNWEGPDQIFLATSAKLSFLEPFYAIHRRINIQDGYKIVFFC